jgi:branched-chain amino acid transport system permease protein
LWILALTFPLAGIRVADGRVQIRDDAFLLAGAVFLGGLARGLSDPLGKSLRWIRRGKKPAASSSDDARATRSMWRSAFFAAITILILLSLPFWGSEREMCKYVDVAIMTFLYAVLALGLNVTVGWTGLLVLGHAAFFGLGAYTYAILSLRYAIPFWVALPLGGVVAAAAGLLLGTPSLRLRGDYLAIVTLGFGEVVRYLLKNLSAITGGEKGLPNEALPGEIADPQVFSVVITRPVHYYYLTLALVCLTAFFMYRLHNSRVGRAWIAIREDETAAQAMGIDTFHMKLLAFSIGSFWAGLAGVVYAARMNFVNPEAFKFDYSVLVLAMVILGGMGSIPGVMLGAVLLWVIPWALRDPIPALLNDYLPPAWASRMPEIQDYRVAIFGLLLVVMMVFRPQGLVASRRRQVGLRPERAR